MTTQPEDLRSEPATRPAAASRARSSPTRPDLTVPPRPRSRRPAVRACPQRPSRPRPPPPGGDRRRRRATAAVATADRVEAGGAEGSAVGDGDAGGATEAAGAGRRRRRWFRYTLPGAGGALLFTCLAFTPSCCRAVRWCRAWSAGSPRRSDTAPAWSRPGSGARSPTGTARRPDHRVARLRRHRRRRARRRVRARASTGRARSVTSWGWRRQPGRPGAGPGAGRCRVRRAGRPGPRPAARLRWLARLLGRWIGPRRPARSAGSRSSASPRPGQRRPAGRARLRRGRGVLGAQRGSRPRARSSRPRDPVRRPGSLVSWDSLGREGRKFTGLGPTASDISAFTGGPALAPIRAYAGLESATSTEDRADLAVADLERAGGFDRKNLVVATTTGSGWVDPARWTGRVHDRRGLGDRRDPVLIPAVLDLLPGRPGSAPGRPAGRCSTPSTPMVGAARRTAAAVAGLRREPRLVRRRDRLQRRAGPAQPHRRRGLRRTAELQHALPGVQRQPRPGQPEVAPVYRDGRTVRFDERPRPTDRAGGRPGTGRRVLYLQHPSDPIVWWTRGCC